MNSTLSTQPQCACVVLAAGKGTRMRSRLPKVLHAIAGRSMIAHVLTTANAINPARAVLVLAPEMDAVKAAAQGVLPVTVALQTEQKGTGHAVKMALPALEGFEGDVVVMYGDTPLVTPENLRELLAVKHRHAATIALLAMEPRDPTGYGRVVMSAPPLVERIVECKDANAAEKTIRHVWGGVMAFDAAFLRATLPTLTPSPVTGEYYLTTLIEMAAAQGKTTVMALMSEEEAMGVNSREQLAEAEAAFQARERTKHMANGVTLTAPETVFFSADTKLAQDVIIEPNVVFGAGVSVGEGSRIRAFSYLENATVGANVTVGPFARLRPGAVLEEGAHVGNFVEIKASTIGAGAKVNHLSYVGDAEVGAKANIGAGTITCNYDGVKKHKTVIGAGAFIGSNTSLVAPVSIGAGAVTGAGSVITKHVPDHALALERSTQVVKEGWKTPPEE